MSAVHAKGPAEVRANLTPMIDVTFLLIVFFVLVSQIVEVESVDMELPTPIDPASMAPEDEQRAVINVVPAPAGGVRGYRVGGRSFPADGGGAGALAAHLAHLYESNPSLMVNLRADRSTHYRYVEPVLDAVRDAASVAGHPGASARVNLVVVREPGS